MVEEKSAMDQHKYTILVVEDEVFNFKYLEELLSEKGHKILLAVNGVQAVEMFREKPDIDLILMDLKLPILNGIDATKEIRRINSTVPIIAQTAYAMNSDKENALKAGCNDYIIKPIDEALLFEKIEKCCRKLV